MKPANKLVHSLCLTVTALTLLSGFAHAQDSTPLKPPELVTILDNIPVATAQKTPQQTPIDNHDGAVYIANIEPGANGDTDSIDLHTIVRKGLQDDNGEWVWTSHLIEDRTISDEWHTVPSVALDKEGFVHVAYNMHNLPWQYKVSELPNEIDAFEFLGEEISTKEILELKDNNRTNFPELGNSAIAGNQVTYPAFYKDNDGELYVTYRYAAKPALEFKDRVMSSAIAKYDSEKKIWSNIGAQPELVKGDFKKKRFNWFKDPVIPEAFSSSAGWTSYHPRLSFGPNNSLNVLWLWRKGIAGTELERPCFLSSEDQIEFRNSRDEAVALPATAQDCSNILGVSDSEKFYSIGNTTINSKGEPHFVLSPVKGDRKIVSFRNNQWMWEDSPYGATEIFFDDEDNLWALATGLTILARRPNDDEWLKILITDQRTECRPRASLTADKSIAYIYTPNCRNNTVSVKMLKLDLSDYQSN